MRHAPEPLTPLADDEQALLRRTLGLRCRKAREGLDLSQVRLAEALGRSASWVREVERGDQYAPPYLIVSLARATGRSPSWFYGLDDEANLERVAERLALELKRNLTL